MAKNQEKVMEFVEKQLESNPDAKSSELFERAKKMDAGVGDLSLRQFHARYPLQIKRRQSMSQRGSRPARKSSRTRGTKSGTRARGRAQDTGSRDAVREVFLRFASDLSRAQAPHDLVRIVAGVDGYVDDAIKAAGK